MPSVASRMICRTRGAIHPHPPPNLPLEGGGTWLPPLQGEGWGGDGAVFGFGIVKHCIRRFIHDATLAIPACVEQLIAGDSAIVNLGGGRKEISLALAEDVAVGGYVIVHVGFALQKLDPEEAALTLALFAELGGAAPE